MRDPDRMSDDGGAIPLGIDARHFTGTGAGIGPAVNVNLPMLGRTVSLTAKALFDIDSHTHSTEDWSRREDHRGLRRSTSQLKAGIGLRPSPGGLAISAETTYGEFDSRSERRKIS